MIGSATHGTVVSASARCMSTSQQEAGPHQRRERQAALEPTVEERADASRRAPRRWSAGRSPPPPCARRSRDQSTRTDHAAPQVMLKVRMTIARVRTGGCAQSHRIPSTMSWRTWVSTESRTAPRVEPMRDTRTTPSSDADELADERPPMPAANRNAPTGGPTSWLAVRKPACSRELAMPRSALVDEHRRERARGGVGEHLGHARAANTATSTTVMSTRDRWRSTTHEQREDDRAHEVRDHHDRRRSRRSAMRAGVQPEQQPRQSAQQRRPSRPGRASSVCEATSSGPAAIAMPSPMLVVHDEASSHRNRRPRRAGRTVSTKRLTSARPYAGGRRGAAGFR